MLQSIEDESLSNELDLDFEPDSKPSAAQNDFNALPIDAKYDRLKKLVQQSKVYSGIITENMKENSNRHQEQLKDQRHELDNPRKENSYIADSLESPEGSSRRRSSRISKNNTSSLSMNRKKSFEGLEDRDSDIKAVNGAKADTSSKILPREQQPATITGCAMKDYQLEGLEWLISLYENGLNGILADEMGLGKTLQCIALYGYLIEHKVKGPFLVVAPLSTIKNWLQEFKKFAPKIRVLEYAGSKPHRATINLSASKANVVVTSYEIIMKDHLKFSKVYWEYLTVDEGHRLKNFQSILVKYLKKLPVGNRLLLTGTPLQNNLQELWSLLNFILPDIFHDLEIFESWFNFDELIALRNGLADGVEKEKVKEEIQSGFVAQLHSILQPFLLRRLKSSVIKSLPPKKEYIVLANLSPLQKLFYRSVASGQLKSTISRVFLKEYLLENYPEYFKSEEGLRFIDQMHTQTHESKEQLSYLTSRNANIRETNLFVAENNMLSKRSSNERSIDEGKDSKSISSSEHQSSSRPSKRRRSSDKSSSGSSDAPRTKYFSSNGISSKEKEYSQEALEKQRTEIAIKAFQLVERLVKSLSLQNGVMQLRKICATHYTFYDPFSDTAEKGRELDSKFADLLWKHSGKVKVLEEITNPLLAQGHKILIFSQFTNVLDLLASYFEERGVKFSRLDGRINQELRNEEIEYFNCSGNTSASVFLLSTRAGGLGLNLVQADTVILFDNDWNPQMDLQAIDRVHRIGQEKPVKIFRLVVRNTIEELLLIKSFGKRALEKMVIEQGHFQLGRVAQELIEKKTDFSVFNTLDSVFSLEKRLHSQYSGVGEPDSPNVNSELLRTSSGEPSVLSAEEIGELMDRSPECYQRQSAKFKSVTYFETTNNMDT